MFNMARSVVAVLALCAIGYAAKLPATWPTCKRTDSDFNQCVAQSVEKILPTFDEDAKELGFGIAPIKVERITLDLGSGPFSLLINAKNVTISGVDKSTVGDANVDFKKNEISFKVLTPLMRLDFMYDAEGKILVIPVKGDGPGFIEIVNPTTIGVITAEPMQKKGKTYWNLKNFSVDISPEKMRCYFNDLLKGNAAVSEQVNRFLNNDWELFFRQVKQPAEEAFSQIFLSMARRVFSRTPINEIFRE